MNIRLCIKLADKNEDFEEIYDKDTVIRSSIKNNNLNYLDLKAIHDKLPFFSGIMLVYDKEGLIYKTILQDLNNYNEDVKNLFFILLKQN